MFRLTQVEGPATQSPSMQTANFVKLIADATTA
jgi:hypothetical protein